MSKQESGLSEAQAKYVNSWFDGLTFTREDPRFKYTTNARYQNVCAKIELVEEELTSYEMKSRISDQNLHGGISRKGKCLNCDICSKRGDKTIASDRNMLIGNIQQILPEIRQNFV
ncbi:Hypothetical predicted protein [Paramuricea clavata]|uniref:Uncharacterized protein n=1 Tax=Paramuricea clavata TaxID=317549 RepID=A0A7D9HT77_PARCT|nr:Hypothetical predicted protein [Paramuricea clavata]